MCTSVCVYVCVCVCVCEREREREKILSTQYPRMDRLAGKYQTMLLSIIDTL